MLIQNMTAPARRLALPADEVRAELSRILESPEFAGSRQMTSFLRYVVEEALAGREDRLKERTVAHGALGRDSMFDPTRDCIVRVVAGKLRRALERYYALYGASDPLQIDLPRGSYCPVIRRRVEFCPKDGALPARAAGPRTRAQRVGAQRRLVGREPGGSAEQRRRRDRVPLPRA